MSAEQIIFIILTVITLGSGISVVTNRNLLHAALALMLSFLGVAGYYVLLGSGFLAAAQLLVYIGAISILILFAIMMTRNFMSSDTSAFNSQWVLGLVSAVALFVGLAMLLLNVWGENGPLAVNVAPAVSDEQLNSTVDQLGVAFVSSDLYALPFEAISILLLAALVGAIAIAMEIDVKNEEDEA